MSENRFVRALMVLIALTMLLWAKPSADYQVYADAQTMEEADSDAVILYLGSNLGRVRGQLTPIDPGRNGAAPYLLGGRAMVPVRFLTESFGAQVSYNQVTGYATLALHDTVLHIKSGEQVMMQNGVPLDMPVAPISMHGRMYAPLRAISEAFGFHVFYDRGLIVVSAEELFLKPDKDASWIDRQINELGMVQVARSEADLLSQIRSWQTRGLDESKNLDDSSGAPRPDAPSGAPSPDAPSGAPSPDAHSTTNVQVEGVDEGDILKTDGALLYSVNRNRVLIVRALPTEDMEVLSTLFLGTENLWPEEIYVADGRLTIIGSVQGSGWNGPIPMPMPMPGAMDAPQRSPEIWPSPVMSSTKVLIYDVSSPEQPVRLASYEIEGMLVASRRIGVHVYLVTNKALSRWGIYENAATPQFRVGSGVTEGAWTQVAPTTVAWCPDFLEANYLVVSGIDLDQPAQSPSLYTLLGSGQTVYATADSLVVAVRRYGGGGVILPATTEFPETDLLPGRRLPPYSESTDLYRFTLEAGAATLVSRGTVPGRLLNQFSLDWYENHLRVATTLGWSSQTGEPTSNNQLFILDDMMNLTGAILDIAPGEQIYSARFMGEKGYLVTYRNVDPLYVLDLADPSRPAILGELKIPGYSDYLHPYREGYLLGFGKDAVELENQWDPGTTWAYYQGLKMAMFDVTDVSNPRLLHELHIGDRGTDSSLLRNHRALLFSLGRDLLAFPVSLHEVLPGAETSSTGTAYGSLTWQGLMAFRVTVEDGFEKLAEVSHLLQGDVWNQERHVTRGAYIENILFTISNREIRATDMTTWLETGSLLLE